MPPLAHSATSASCACSITSRAALTSAYWQPDKAVRVVGDSTTTCRCLPRLTYRRADRYHTCRRTPSTAATVILYTSAPWATVMPSLTKTRIHANCDRRIWRIDRGSGLTPRLYIVVTDWRRRRHFRHRGLRVGGSAALGCGWTCWSSARCDRHAEL
jgi:hypothetical protein